MVKSSEKIQISEESVNRVSIMRVVVIIFFHYFY